MGEGGEGDGEVEGGDDGLSGHVDDGDGEVGDAELVGHELVKVLAVGLEDVFPESEAVNDGEDGVNSINHQEDEVGKIACENNETAKGKEDYERNAHRTNIASKASGSGAKVEEVENQKRKSNNVEQIVVNKLQPIVVDVPQRGNHHKRVSASNTVDTIHEIPGIDCAGRYHQRNESEVPGQRIESAIIEHKKHSGKVKQDANPPLNLHNIVQKTD